MFDSIAIQKQIKESYGEYQFWLEKIYAMALIAQRCESPIESILFWEFVKQWNGSAIQESKDMFYPEFDTNSKTFHVMGLYVQLDVPIGKTTYRADFGIECYNCNTKEFPVLYVEVDGHEFHERTKEQAQRDKRRDRAFQGKGLPIMRFTGSEVYRDPKQVVNEISQWIKSYGQSTT